MLSTSTSSGGSTLQQAWQSVSQNVSVLRPAASRLSGSRSIRRRRPETSTEESQMNLQMHLDASRGLLTAWIVDLPPTSFPRLNPHWTATSHASSESFFENNFGFPASQLDVVTPSRAKGHAFRAFLRPRPAHFQAVRGFKSRRTTSILYDYQGVPFQKTSDKQSAAMDRRFRPSLFISERLAKDPAANANNLLLDSHKVDIDKEEKKEKNKKKAKEDKESSSTSYQSFWDWVQRAGAVAAIGGLLAFVYSGMNNGMKLGVTVNEIQAQDIEITFEDVRGCDEAKEELQEIVEFLMNPEKFSQLGGKLPKGCLLVGPPGTGKTLLARAVAGEAGVPFFHAAGPEFDEVLVGLGAKRVRELFKAAKAKAPCVVFIDEIDSVGSKRVNSSFSPYANQTINQLLTEMDGFVSSEGVIVLGATNRSEDLDKALTRPGRFDSQVTVPLPDIKGRKEILDLYVAKTTHDNSVDLDVLARITFGFSAADLENMVNTAAIRAAVEGQRAVSMRHFEFAHDKHTLGTDWKSRKREAEDLKITAYHEAGHTLVAMFSEHATPLHKVTIVSKGQSGGHTAFLPKNDSNFQTKAQLMARMDTAMGGRAAEEIIFGADKVTGGASSDLSMATNVAEAVVTKLGMSDIIGLRVIPDPSPNSNNMGPISNDLIDSEVNKLLKDSYKRAMVILKTHKTELHDLAQALLERETLSADEVKTIIGGKKLGPSDGSGKVNGQPLLNPAAKDKKAITDEGSGPGSGGPKRPVAGKGVLV